MRKSDIKSSNNYAIDCPVIEPTNLRPLLLNSATGHGPKSVLLTSHHHNLFSNELMYYYEFFFQIFLENTDHLISGL